MISISLSGNLGDNQIRYAICRSVAEKNNYDFGINKVVSHDYYGGREQMYFFKDLNYGLPNNTPYGELPPGTTNVWEEKKEVYEGYNYHPFQPDIFGVPPNTKLIIYCGQDARYLNKEKTQEWFTISDRFVLESQKLLKDSQIDLSENTCILSCRGGEYRNIASLFLTHNYWNKSMMLMKKRNPKIKFIVVTEDPEFYKTYFDLPVYHFNIHTDYYIINNAKNIIASNSGFGIFPIWTNKYNPYVIAPKYWAIHNLNNGCWANSNMRSWGCFNFMDASGQLSEMAL